MSHDHHPSAQIRSEPVPPCSYTTNGHVQIAKLTLTDRISILKVTNRTCYQQNVIGVKNNISTT